jgi:hypothetical protein
LHYTKITQFGGFRLKVFSVVIVMQAVYMNSNFIIIRVGGFSLYMHDVRPLSMLEEAAGERRRDKLAHTPAHESKAHGVA